ncbi:ribosomal protein L2, putative [Leishmania tarentolae]|uniref:Ribosomal protein L2, putative n=1 Tax=Leishmania tarentolae TaxID=5689 RepID=A0A640KEJ0_LEITA|nr:ribosomal protein L2, putative [Leishmania tarentolae]
MRHWQLHCPAIGGVSATAAAVLAGMGPSSTAAATGTPSSSSSGSPSVVASTSPLFMSRRGVKLVNPIGKQGSQHYGLEPKLEAGRDTQLKHTEMYDGYTDDFGVFKEGPPVTLRLEYVRSPDHGYSQHILQKDVWSPFQVGANMMSYTPLYYDWKGFSSRDYFGHRSGTNPGSKVLLGHYRRDEVRSWGYRIMVNHKPQKRIPKWLACVVHIPRKKTFLGFFLYANGAYVAELLTYKQLPRIIYNKAFQGCLPTIGQTVSLTEVTYGKEIHSVEMYPGHGGVICRASGTAAVVLRGSEPNLVPLLLPSKEVRLFDSTCHAVFGRRAGVMYNKQRNFSKRSVEENMPHRPKVHSKTKRVSSHPAGGGNGGSPNLLTPLDWRIHPRNCVKTKYWLSGYILRGRQYNRNQPVADLKSKTYSWAHRDPVYR